MKFTEEKSMYEYIKKLDDDKKSKEWVAFSDSFNFLMRNFEKYIVPDLVTRNIEKFDNDAYTQLNELFDKTVEATNDFLKITENPKNDIDETRKNLVENLNNEFLSKAYVELKNIDPNAKYSLKDAMEKIRNKKIDITGQNTPFKGKNIYVKFQDKKEEKQGFFTSKVNYEPKNSYNKLISDISIKYPEYADFFKSLKGNQSIAETLKPWNPDSFGYIKDIGDIDYYSAVAQINKTLLTDESKNQYEVFKDEPGFIYACYDFARQSASLYSNITINTECLQIEEQDNIDMRSSAMSSVAGLFGKDKLLAKSINIEVNDGSNLVSGTFTENVIGKDIKNLNDDDPMYVFGEEVYDQPNVKKQLADLQIIDYVCGNVDRHGGNMFYQFDIKDSNKPKLVGIQGINNDASFMKAVPGVNESVRTMGSINDMKVIDEDMAKKIMQLNEGMLKATLIGYGLNKEALDSAWERTKNLQDAIKIAQTFDKKKDLSPVVNNQDAKTQIVIVPSVEWKNITLKDLAENIKTNIFKTVNNLQKTMTDKQIPNLEKAMDVLVADQGLENSVIRTDQELGEFYNDAKSAKNLIGTPKRYKVVLNKLETLKEDSKKSKETNIEKMYQDKLKKLDELKQLVDKYKQEKQDDGTIDKDGNLLVNLTGKDKARVDVINKLDKYIEEKTSTLNQHALRKIQAHEEQEKELKACERTNNFKQEFVSRQAEKTEKTNNKPEVEKVTYMVKSKKLKPQQN